MPGTAHARDGKRIRKHNGDNMKRGTDMKRADWVSKGNIYTAEVGCGRRMQKLSPR